jgi:hypothetical protein
VCARQPVRRKPSLATTIQTSTNTVEISERGQRWLLRN